MKTNKFSISLSVAAGLAALLACAPGCAKKNHELPQPTPPAPKPLPTNSVVNHATNAAAATNIIAAPATNTLTVTNVQATSVITNPPPAETTVNAPATTTLAETNVPGHAAVVEMPATPPAAPTNFYPATIASNPPNACCLSPVGAESGTNFFLRFRAGYEHIYHGDNNDSYWVSAKFYAYGDGLREQAGKNGWLIPDADAEISSGYLAKPDNNPNPGSDPGLRFRADFTWPWLRWPALVSATNSGCPFCHPLAFTLGPTVNVGFDHLYDETDYRFARYAGVRLTFNRSGFIEYTAGETEGLDGTRQQVVAEIPFYESRDGEVRYYLRGLWNHGSSSKPGILEGGLFLEMPFSTLVSPCKWGDLVPFAN
jgi:hypothetical protein